MFDAEKHNNLFKQIEITQRECQFSCLFRKTKLHEHIENIAKIQWHRYAGYVCYRLQVTDYRLHTLVLHSFYFQDLWCGIPFGICQLMVSEW